MAPADPRLPGGDGALDRDRLARLIDRLAGGRGHDGPRSRTDPGAIRFEAVRYKPGVRLIIALSVPEPDGGRARYTVHAFRRGESEAAAGKLRDDGAPETMIHHDPGQETLIIRFPWDHELPGLRRMLGGRDGASYVRRLIPGLDAPENRLRSRSFDPTLLRYKPERHAVYRLDFEIRDKPKGERRDESLMARVFTPQDPPFMATTSLGGVTPRTLAYDGHRGVALEERLDGQQLGEGLRASSSPLEQGTLLRRVGAAVAALHLDVSPEARAGAAPGPPHWPVGAMESAERLLRRVSGSAADAFAVAAAPVLAILGSSPRTDRVRGHGDLHVNQILWSEHRIGLVDIEKSRLSEPEMDLGMLLHSVQETLADGVGALDGRECLAPLISGYVSAGGREPDPTRLCAWSAWTALMRSTAPLRNLHPQWKSMAAARLQQAERSVAGTVPVEGSHPKG